MRLHIFHAHIYAFYLNIYLPNGRILLEIATRVDHETEIHYLTDQVREIARQREIYYGELIELKSQLGVVEDSRDAIRRDLLQANRKLREGQSFSTKS